VDATHDGRTLLYTDSATGVVGFVDVSDPATPVADGTVPIGGEPTSVAVGKRYALVATDTSDGDFDRPTRSRSRPTGGTPRSSSRTSATRTRTTDSSRSSPAASSS
jgi:hypothetical protein